MNTQTLDKLYLEISQFTTARTQRENELTVANVKLLKALKAVTGCDTVAEAKDMISVVKGMPQDDSTAASLLALRTLVECHT